MARLKISVVLKSGARIGPGKVKLLESVSNTGSISAAAREMAMSYKRAWLLLDSMNQAFAEPVVMGAPGGRRGGGATLTPFGRALLDRYKRIENTATEAARSDLTALTRATRPDSNSKVRPR
jgi:molybdate transport system regulatory protein